MERLKLTRYKMKLDHLRPVLDAAAGVLRAAHSDAGVVFLFIILAAVCRGQVVYSDLGTNNSFNAVNAWCVGA